MAKLFSVASWNVKHFGAVGKNKEPKKPLDPIVNFLAGQNADVVAIYEVLSSKVFLPLVEAMPKYQFYITEGPQTQEILVGVKNGFSSFITQKLEFKSSRPGLRPGVLVTLQVNQEYYPILFLHLKSLSDPEGFGLRDGMLQLAIRFREKLDEAPGGMGNANYIFVGDLNTMGMQYPYSDKNISGFEEIDQLKRRAKLGSYKMQVLDKTEPNTWMGKNNSNFNPADLDHVVATDHLQFKNFGDGKYVDVRGWPQEPTDADKNNWVEQYSDHALLYFEVHKT